MGQSETKKAPGGFMQLAVALLLVCVMGFGLGIGMRVMHGPSASVTPEAGRGETDTGDRAGKVFAGKDDHGKTVETPSDVTDEAARPDKMADMIVEPLAPVITNVANPKSVWIRLEGSIMIKTGSETSPKVLAAQAGQHVMAYLRSIELKQVEGTSGLFHVTEDLNEVMRSFSGGQVRQILISGFIVE